VPVVPDITTRAYDDGWTERTVRINAVGMAVDGEPTDPSGLRLEFRAGQPIRLLRQITWVVSSSATLNRFGLTAPELAEKLRAYLDDVMAQHPRRPARGTP
jgi:hypothetical protein